MFSPEKSTIYFPAIRRDETEIITHLHKKHAQEYSVTGIVFHWYVCKTIELVKVSGKIEAVDLYQILEHELQKANLGPIDPKVFARCLEVLRDIFEIWDRSPNDTAVRFH